MEAGWWPKFNRVVKIEGVAQDDASSTPNGKMKSTSLWNSTQQMTSALSPSVLIYSPINSIRKIKNAPSGANSKVAPGASAWMALVLSTETIPRVWTWKGLQGKHLLVHEGLESPTIQCLKETIQASPTSPVQHGPGMALQRLRKGRSR